MDIYEIMRKWYVIGYESGYADSQRGFPHDVCMPGEWFFKQPDTLRGQITESSGQLTMDIVGGAFTYEEEECVG